MKRRLLSIFCALCLCLTLLPTAALADGLETGTPTLLNGEGETDYATPSEEDGWTQLSDGTWFLVAEKTYEQPFYSDLPIHVEAGGSLTAPSITVGGRVEVTGNASLNCSGELRAEKLHVSVGATVGTLSCETVFVSGYAILTVTSRWNCSGTVEVDGALYLPAETVPNWNNFSGNGTVYIGETAYTTAGVSQGTAMLMLFPGASASGEGYTWDGDTCTLTLDGFARTYDTEAEGGIGILAEGRAITLVLKGENVMNGLSVKEGAVGIYCVGSSLTLKGAGSLDCEGSAGALVISGGSLALAEGYSLNEEADIFNETSGAGGMVIEAGTDETGLIPATSFTIQSEQSGDGTGSYSAEVKGTYQPGGSGAVVYSVDIAWTDMSFTYTGAGEGTWDPETHQYIGSSEGAWTASNDSITVTNHSNAAVKATASYQAETGYESTTMTFGNNEATVATAVGTEVASAPSATITVTPGGTLAESANGGKIGTITVSIAAAE